MKKQKLKNLPLSVEPTEVETQLENIKAVILEQYRFEKLISIGSHINEIRKESCFLTDPNLNSSSVAFNSYYLLAIPSKLEKCADLIIQQRLEEKLKSIASVTILIHRMDEFNAALQNGSSFFKSVYKKGIILYDKNEELFVSPCEGAPFNKRINRKEQFWNQWYKLSTNFLKGGKFFIEEKDNGLAVFMLHQALQHCYSAMIRVLTGYRTNSNSLRRLMKLIDLALPDSSFVVPNKTTPEDVRLLNLLLKGFSDARYDENLIVTQDDLSALQSRIILIMDNANKLCFQRINDLKDGKVLYNA